MTTFCRLWAVLSFFLLGLICSAASRPTGVPYQGALVVDADSGHILFEDNADIQNPPASMTKLMTFAVLHDKLAAGDITLETSVTVIAADAKIGGTQVWLKEKEVFPVEELIYAMMIQSANDAAYALARVAAGSVEGFVGLMNAKAQSLGMTQTQFSSPHGLPPTSRRLADGDLSTPRDFVKLCRYLLLETDVVKYASVRSRPFGVNRPAGPVAMVNHNHLLGKVAGLNGLKTGFTNGAGFCLSATVERNGRRIVAVVMGGADAKSRDFRMAELLERGFAALPATGPSVQITASASQVKSSIANPVKSGAKQAQIGQEQISTEKEPMFIFRVIPPEKKP